MEGATWDSRFFSSVPGTQPATMKRTTGTLRFGGRGIKMAIKLNKIMN